MSTFTHLPCEVRYAYVVWLLFLIRHQIFNASLKEIGLHLQILLTTSHSVVNTIERPYVLKKSTNMHFQYYRMSVGRLIPHKIQLSLDQYA